VSIRRDPAGRSSVGCCGLGGFGVTCPALWGGGTFGLVEIELDGTALRSNSAP
jgi:hypothetical protein